MDKSTEFVVASRNGDVGIAAATQVLRDGGSPIDAVEAGIKLVESNVADTGVGRGGLPNILGDVELDASIMNGATRAAGAVGAVRDYEHVITLARRVMEDLPHVTLVGPAAERFAAGLGLTRSALLTEGTRKLWDEHLRERLHNDSAAIDAVHRLRELAENDPALVATWVRRVLDPTRNTGTVNFIARDRHGTIASGVSTSGWKWKYPGRLGDSPLVGAGNYADNRYGAATCTGHGEVTTRCGTARSIVTQLKLGVSVQDALLDAALDTVTLDDPHSGGVDILAVDRHGNCGAITTTTDEQAEGRTFVYQSTDMDGFEVRERTVFTGAKSAG